VREIGKGGSGKVNEYERRDGKRVAIKEICLDQLDPIVIVIF
jgi:hypothetical protein